MLRSAWQRIKPLSFLLVAIVLGYLLGWASSQLARPLLFAHRGEQRATVTQSLQPTAERLSGFAAGLRPAHQTVRLEPLPTATGHGEPGNATSGYGATFDLWLRNPGEVPIDVTVAQYDASLRAVRLQPDGTVPAGHEALVQVSLETDSAATREVTLYLRARQERAAPKRGGVAMDLPLTLQLLSP